MLGGDDFHAIIMPIMRQIEEVNDEYLQLIGKTIKKCSKLTQKDMHRLEQMKMTGMSTFEIEYKLANIAGTTQKRINDIFQAVAIDGTRYAKELWGREYTPYNSNLQLIGIVESLARQATETFANYTANTAFMRYDANGNKVATDLQGVYNSILDKSTIALQIGQTDFYSQLRKDLRLIADTGICTSYIDNPTKAGLKVDYATGYHRRLDSAVRQNLLWGLKQCANRTQELVGQQFGADGWEIDYHPHPRPTHAEMGGRQYSMNPSGLFVDGVFYPPFASVENLLEDYGCLHVKWAIICGISVPTYSKDELAKLKADDEDTEYEFEGEKYSAYELTQLQRKLETAIRHADDRQKLAKYAGDTELELKEESKINSLIKKYTEVSKIGDLPIFKERMFINGHRYKNVR